MHRSHVQKNNQATDQQLAQVMSNERQIIRLAQELSDTPPYLGELFIGYMHGWDRHKTNFLLTIIL